MSNVVGVTGTQEGLTQPQYYAAQGLVKFLDVCILHHGDCIGADDELDTFALWNGILRVIHPPINDSKRAWCERKAPGALFNKFEILEEKEYLERNHDIVDVVDLLLAFPKGMMEELRSGTWATIRYAMKMEVPIIIVFPDGSMRWQ